MQKFKHIFYRTDLAVTEFNFTFNFCRAVIEKFEKLLYRHALISSMIERLKLEKIDCNKEKQSCSRRNCVLYLQNLSSHLLFLH